MGDTFAASITCDICYCNPKSRCEVVGAISLTIKTLLCLLSNGWGKKLSCSSDRVVSLFGFSIISSCSLQWVTLKELAQKCKFISNFMDLKTLQIAWTLPRRSKRRCSVMGLIRWCTWCQTAWVVRHCWLLVRLAHLCPAIHQRNTDQDRLTPSVSWAPLFFFPNVWAQKFLKHSIINK